MTNWKTIANIQNVFVKFWNTFRGKLKGNLWNSESHLRKTEKHPSNTPMTNWKAIANSQNVFVNFWKTFRGKLKGNHEILNHIYVKLKSIHQILQWQTERQSQTFKTYSWNFEKHLGESWKAIMKFESHLRKTEKHPSNTPMTNWKAIANI